MQIHVWSQADRLTLLLKIFAAAGRSQDGRPSTEQLRGVTGLSREVLWPRYRSDRSPETLQCLVDGAAQLLAGGGLLTPSQAARLGSWLAGEIDEELQQLLELEARIVKCTGEGGPPCPPSCTGARRGWFDPETDADRWEPRLRMCLPHIRAKQTPAAAVWEQQVAEQLPHAPLPPTRRKSIVEAFQRLRATYQAVKYKSWAEAAGLPVPELRRTLSRAGVKEKPRENKKHFGRYAGLLPPVVVVWSLLWADPAWAGLNTVAAERPRPIYLIGDLWRAWLERLRRWLAGLAGAPGAGRPSPVLGSA